MMDKYPGNARLNEGFNILRHVSSKHVTTGKALDASDLLFILKSVMDSSEPVVEIMKTLTLKNGSKMSSYFEEHFLDEYSRLGVSDALILKLAEVFNEVQVEEIKKMLLQFKSPGDHIEYEKIVSKLVLIGKELSVMDKTVFIQKLTASPDFYQDARPLSEDSHPFVEMLDHIFRKEAVDTFVGFMGALREFKQKTKTKTTEALTERALLYIGTLLPAVRMMEDRVIPEVELLPVVREMLFRTPKAELESETYAEDFQAILVRLNTIVSENPMAKRALIKLVMGHLADDLVTSDEGLLEHVARLTNKLQEKFKKIEDKNTVLSLCLHFNQAKATDTRGLTPDGLLVLFDAIDTVDEASQQHVLKLAVALLNSDKGYTLDDFKAFLALVKEDADFLTFTTRVYKKAPFPDLKTLMAWHAAAKAGTTSLDDAYQAFDIVPCHRELFSGKPPKPLNGFHLKKAKAQLAKMQGLEAKIDLKRCQEMTDWARGVSTDELLAQLAWFNPNHSYFDAAKEVDYEALVALVAELLYRSKGRDVRGLNGQFELGSSMEINTTQYLAILSLLKTPGHVTSQIGTGEGKSRIMMIANVCQYAQGKTVDFVTSDVQLAQRDFVEFQPFFDMVGAKTSLIFADSDSSMYQKHGINFSDPSSLNLFRNKAASLGQHPLVMDEDESNRALLLDEADKTYFDMAGTRFNFSRESDVSIRDMRWVYPLMMSYFSKEKVVLSSDSGEKKTITPTDLYYENVDLSREKFLNFARANCSKAELHRLKSVSEAQIEQWQTAAVTANELDYQKDFVIEPNTAIKTPRGVKVSSEARLLFSNRVSRDSKFSFGVHQCLHARLNRARETLHPEDDTPLGDVLRTCDTAFYVQDEKQIVYSSTSKNMTDDYKKGSLKAVTGTSGSLMERAEAREVYGRCDDTPMTFIDVPKDKAMQRVDRALRLTRNKSQQITVLVDLIKKARSKNQPILIIAENDEESAAIYKALNKTYFKSDKAIQRIHSQMSLDDERAAINEAGKACQITVSTEMVGRGTDIVLKGEAKKHGLSVMGTYLPRERDLKQIIGRSGRFGAKGDTRLVLDKVRLRQRIGKRTLGRGGFYYNAEAYIRREQALMDRKRQCERLIKNTVGDFRKSITDNFFDELFPTADKEQQKELLTIWSGFFDKTDKAWNETWPHIQALLLKKEISVSQVQKLLDGYATEVQQRWDAARSQVQRQPIAGKAVLHAEVPSLALDENTKALLSDFVLKEQAPSERRVYDHYDSAHDGRYVHYSHWSIPLKASLKGWANLIPFVNFDDARRPFANTRAWFAGHGQLFPWLRVGQHDGGIMGLLLLGVLGAVVGVALSLTGVLAPLGLFLFGQTAAWVSAGLFGFMGFSTGAVLGVSIGSLVDYAREKPSDKEEAVNFAEVAEVQSVNKTSDKKVPTQTSAKSASKTPDKPSTSEPRVSKPGFFKDPGAGGQAPEEPGNTPPTQSGPGQSGDGG
ncbi:MAG: hypothetical protein K0U37_06860 [Gammaproteobacteria bacterium]|nr:hypothetical protein [Gammaproteobacteria bacterium]